MSSSEATKQRLKTLTATTDWKKVNNMRRWGHPEGRTITLVNIHHQQRNITIHASMKLRRHIERYLRIYPQYVSSHSVETIGANLVTATGFYLQGHIGEPPLSNYLLYLTWMDWKYQQKFMSSPKRKAVMYKHMEQIGIINLLFEEAQKKIIDKGIKLEPYYAKPNKDYISLEEAQAYSLPFGSYSFDK